MLRLKFINFSVNNIELDYQYAHINPNYLILKSYYKFKSPDNYDKVIWTKPILFDRSDVYQIVEKIVQDEIDVLCFSLYVWNSHHSFNIMRLVKEKLPTIKIIIGGPDVYANNEENYFDEHPYVDYAVYGDGESAFVEIIDSIIENRELSTDTVNVVTRKKKYPHEVFNDVAFKSVSPFLNEQEEFESQVQELTDIGYKPQEITVRWERARGCPYRCSFCDWNSGLHNKVKRKTNNWKEEIDYLLSFNLKIRVTDANWGLYKEDLEITKYILDNNGQFSTNSLAKLKKENVFQLFEMFVNAGSRNILIALQDINETVLKNVARPEIPWQDHKAMLLDFKNKHKQISYAAELIWGLPGQTVETCIDTLEELANCKFESILTWHWEFLANSPAAQKEYQEKYLLSFEKFIIIDDYFSFESEEAVHKAVSSSNKGYMISKRSVKTYSAEFYEILMMMAFSYSYQNIDKNKVRETYSKFIELHKNIFENVAAYMLESGIYGVKLDDGKIISFREYIGTLI